MEERGGGKEWRREVRVGGGIREMEGSRGAERWRAGENQVRVGGGVGRKVQGFERGSQRGGSDGISRLYWRERYFLFEARVAPIIVIIAILRERACCHLRHWQRCSRMAYTRWLPSSRPRALSLLRWRSEFGVRVRVQVSGRSLLMWRSVGRAPKGCWS